MKTIGQLVEQTIELSDRGLHEMAFVPACEALQQTAQKVYQKGDSAEPEFQRFIRENWQLISFMGIPRHDNVPANLPFSVRRAVPSFNVQNLAEEIIIYAVRQTLMTHRMPLEIGFNKFGGTIIENEKLLFPKSLLFAVIGSVVFNPVNKNETVAERYWLNVWDFKMFISELWGRNDLVERIKKLYRR